ncbi:MAG TPA: hypothetical protein VLC11_07675 [Gemmatimonadales bacterium]|nr:hypothetical protein [Gemmatimonadales bacterium]
MGTERSTLLERKRRQAFLARLELAMASTGITRAEVGRKVGAEGGTVYEWFTKESLPEGPKMLLFGEAFPQVSMHWLLTGRGAMLAPDVRGGDAALVQGAGVALARLERWLAEERAWWASPHAGKATPASATPEELQAAELARAASARKRPPRSQAS